ncbi:hypothetical protein K466DRAFT_595475 [Polyporus arcularius HHB13444]|uniref:Uncharacterized protein n=1 Tax=Polyporus arcularius HHB13444 TaxID=1314778 RepID=A0A5C3PUQ1_9APHY|nr:hypothetical protein K466DRAFT_595475 [Polyporus arcularius HHB13444]
MSGKTLSNGTMSLRFMQNAQRAKLQAQVEAEQAKVKDDAEWSVSQEVRDAWGMKQSSSLRDEVQHETSYVPFIFQADGGEASSSATPSSSTPTFRGRRTFNARGQEVVQEVSKAEQDGSVSQNGEPGADSRTRGEKPRSRFEKLPTSISGFRTPISTQRDTKSSRTKTAQMLIREDVSVRPPAFLQPSDSAPIPPATGFIKPAGIDEPVLPPRKTAADSRKRDRVQDPSPDQPGSEGKKKKKRKEKNTSS